MINTKRINSIEELEDRVSLLREMIQKNREDKYTLIPEILFRGQKDASWGLKTTLERYTQKEFSFASYNRLLATIHPAISSYTGKKWTIDRDIPAPNYPPSYELMVYARHHGFPSPLLDWSRSLYVALFFAFQNACENHDVAIFSFIDRIGSAKSAWSAQPHIIELGPYVESDKRHFLQQAQYTIAIKEDENYSGARKYIYCSHEEALSGSTDDEQDITCKFILSGNLKQKVLTRLHEMNINAFSLYSDENSLMEMLAYQEIAIKDPTLTLFGCEPATSTENA